MSAALIAIIGLIIFLSILAVGVPIGIAMGLVGVIGIITLRGLGGALATLSTIPFSSMESWSLSVIPMFLLMGYLAFQAGFTKDAYQAAYKWLGRIPGGVAVATLFGGAAFGACCGSSVAATAALGRIAIPEMRRFNYDMKLACGSVACAGTLAALIPPSIMLVFYGIITETSIGKLLIAGIIPGIISMLAFSALVYVRAVINPALAPKGEILTLREKLSSLKNSVGIGITFLVVVFGIFFGVFTPTEAGALGAFTVMVLAFVMRRMNWKNFWEAVKETVRVSCSVLMIVIGAYIFIQFLAISRLPMMISEWIVSLPYHPNVVFIGILLVYLVLGMFLDAIGLVLLTVPIIFPAIVALGFNPIWFGVILVKMVEIGLLTPPVGVQTYVLKGVVPDIPIETILLGILPFFILDFVFVVGVLTFFPQIILFLPNLMK